MEINNTCRICLVVHKPMVRLGDTGKKKFIESIFRQNGFRYNLNARHQICYICDALLSKSWNFIERVLRAQRILEKLISDHPVLPVARLQKIDRCKEKLNYTDLAVQSIATVGVTENTVQEKQIYLDIIKQEVKQEPDNQLLGQNSMDDVYEDPPVDEFADVFEINSSNIICVNTDESLGTKETNTVVSVDPLAIDNLSIKETDPNYNIFFPTKQEKLSGLSRELKKKSTALETKKNALSTEIENRSGFPKDHSLVIATEDLSIPTAVRTQSDEYQNCVKIDIEIDGTVSFEQSIDESNALIISSESDRDTKQKEATGVVSKKGKKSASILHNEVESVSGDAAESALILHNELASVMGDDTLAVAPSPKNIQKIKKVTPKPAKPKPVKRILYRSEESDLTETEDEVTNKRKSSDEDYNPDEYSESSDSVDERVFPTTCDECDAIIASRKEHYYHYLEYHPNIKYPYGEKGKTLFICHVCGVKVMRKSHYQTHILTHTDSKVKCEFCPKVFRTQTFMMAHLKRVHSARKFICDYCHKGFPNKGAVKLHIRTHINYKPYKCHICGAGFAHNGNRNLHVRVKHQNLPYPGQEKKRLKRKSENSSDDSDTLANVAKRKKKGNKKKNKKRKTKSR